MKKGCFINSICMDEENVKSSGVMKKVYSQIEVLRKYFEVDHLLINTYPGRQNMSDKIKRRLPFFPVDYNWKYSDKFAGYDFIYFRKSDIDYTVYKFFKDIKKHNPDCKIIFEIPTYPYEKENFHGKKDFPLLLKDRVNTRKLHKCVDRIVTYSADDLIFDIETIKTINGLDFEKNPLRKPVPYNYDINIIAVASFSPAHGYDRLIEGIGQYYENGGTRHIVFHLVGDGECVDDYKKIIKRYSLEKNIILYGFQHGEKLDEIYDKCNVAVDVLAGHRKGLASVSSLKSREYSAKGFPIISGCKIDFLPENYQYFLKINDDESPIDVNTVLCFVDKVYQKSSVEVATSIREHAIKICDMTETMKPIIDYILV